MKRLFSIFAGAGFAALTLAAAPPSGSFTNHFSTNDVALWDFTGLIPLEQTVVGTAGVEIPVAFNVLVDQDNRGRLRGAGGTTVVIGEDTVTGQFRVTGRVWTSGNVVRARLTVKLNGTGEIGGESTTFRISAVHHFELNVEELQLDGSVKGAARFAKLVNGPIRGDSVSPLAEGNDGSWTLTMEIVSTKRLAGGATATLVNGRSFVFNLKGSHSETSDESRINLRGVGGARPVRLDVRATGPDLSLTELKGKALGQNLNYRPMTAQ